MNHDRGSGRRLAALGAILVGATALLTAGVTAGAAASGGYGTSAVSGDETADVVVSLSDSPDPVDVGGEVAYTIAIKDRGPGNAARIHLHIALPQSFELLGVDGARGCSTDDALNCALPELAKDGTASVVVHARPHSAGMFTVVVSGRSPWLEPGREGTTARGTTEVEAPSRVQVIEHVINDGGGTASARDFAIAVDGSNVTPAAFAGDESGTTVALDSGSYAVHILPRLGYRTTLSPECAGTIAPGERRTCTVTSDDLLPLALSLTSDPTRLAPSARVRYTVTLTNRNHEAVTARSLAVVLPSGFSYRAGSGQGTPGGDPQVAGQTLTWGSSFDVPADGSTATQFVAVAASEPGSYTATGSASVDAPNTVAPATTGGVTVAGASPPPPPQPAPAPPAPQPVPAPAPAPRAPQPAPPAPAPAQAPAPGAVAPPVFQQSADLEPVAGTVLVRLPGTRTFVPLSSALQAPIGTEVDVTAGEVGLSTVDAAGTGFHARFSEGRFKLAKQLANGVTRLVLSGGDFRTCGKATRSLSSADRKKKPKRPRSSKRVRHLWGSGKGKFETRGRYVAATVHGTTWLTQDRCDASVVRVKEGVVAVRDLVRRKTVSVAAGQSYVARPRR